MRRSIALALLLSLIVGCGAGDPPAPQFNLDGFAGAESLEDIGETGDALTDGSMDLPPDLPPDEIEPKEIGEDMDTMPDVAPGCVDDEDCLDAFDGIPLCQRPACADGVCVLVSEEDGTPCADDDPCTTEEACLEGACAAGTWFDCNDDDPCTDDSCDGAGSCVHENNTEPCDDLNLCTLDDVCAEGTCVGVANLCDDGNPCTFDGCEPVTGECLHEAASIPCDDGDACTDNDFCVEGTCLGLDVLNCDDGNLCTDDSCDPLLGCQHGFNGLACDDGEECTPVDLCVEGVCTGLENICLCDDDGDCQPLQDGDLCNGSLACLDGLCQIDPQSIITCDDPEPDDCVKFECDTATGECQGKSKDDDEACDDHDVCTLGETCQTGLCVSDDVVSCDDNQLCTAEVCDPMEGCQYAPSLAPCDDGDPCTDGDACTEGLLCMGAPKDCDDGNPCTLDACDPATGTCAHTPKTCDDGDLCTEDLCDPDSGACLFALNLCTDTDPCTIDSCDGATGDCVHEPKDCGDADPCTLDTCDGANGDCVHVPITCDDGDQCTIDSCDPTNGDCVHVPITCDDSDQCTANSCDPAAGCVYAPISCDDSDLCTTDSCDPAAGCDHTPITCDDSDLCTTDSCDPAAGCVYTPISCDDGDACTTDSCEPAAGCDHASITCDDSNPCTDDSCDPLGGCTFTPNDAFCDDGDECTSGDHCVDGACTATVQIVCVDMNPCTDDSCDPLSGCTFTPNDDPCDDGDLCTLGDTCSDGGCLGLQQLNCDDGDPCTGDSCDPDSGCVHAPLSGPSCEDGDDCTVGDSCVQGACVAGDDICAPCQGLHDGDPCDDENDETLADMCVEDACVGWTRNAFEPRIGTVEGALHDVTWSQGQFLAVGEDTALVQSGGELKKEIFTWAVTLDQGEAWYHEDSERTDTVYVAVSNDLAVGGNGKATHYDEGTWAPADALEDLLGTGYKFQEIRGLWGGRFADMSNGSPQVDQWWFLGRNKADTLGLTKRCTRESANGAVSWSCANMFLDTYAEYEYPAAMDAVLEPASGPCPTPDGCGWQLGKAWLMSDAVSQLGDTKTYWLDTFTATDTDEWKFLNYLSDAPPYKKDWDDVEARSSTEAWAVGTSGLVARVQGDQLDLINAAGIPSFTQPDWTSVFFIGDLMVITGVLTTDSYSPQGQLRTRTFLLRTHRGSNVNNGWNTHTLATETTFCSGWIDNCEGIVDGNHLTESAAHGGEAYLVGRAWGEGVLPDEDAPASEAALYYLDVPTL